jgi:hypothetical protein
MRVLFSTYLSWEIAVETWKGGRSSRKNERTG